MNDGKRYNVNWKYQRVEKQQMEPGLPSENEHYSIITTLQEVITDEFKWQVANVLAAFAVIVEEFVE